MDYQFASVQRRRRRRRRVTSIVALFLMIVTAAYVWMDKYWPNSERVNPDFGGVDKPIYYAGELQTSTALGKKEGLKLPLELVQDLLDPNIVYEEASNSVIITTKDKVIRLKTDVLTAMVNEKPLQLHVPVEQTASKQIYIPISPLETFYGVQIIESEETGVVRLIKQGDVLPWSAVSASAAGNDPSKPVPLRRGPSIKEPIVADATIGQRVLRWENQGEWARIQLENGVTGYMKQAQLEEQDAETVPAPKTEESFEAWKPAAGSKINLIWEQVERKNPDTATIPDMPGLNVISPTWFHLLDEEGNLKNNADPEYVKWARDRGYQVWALFSNSFDPKMTSEALSTYDKRIKMIKQLLAFAQMYKLQGINIDFENVYLKDKAKVTQFVRELTPLLHQQGLVVSMDVTPKSTNEQWSMFYDRKALAESIDYMMVMTYDEHWASSPKAGSVASLPWVESSITRIMKEDQVPSSKLLLGIPFYTRIWTETVKDGKTQVSSKAVTMPTVEGMIKNKGLKPQMDAASGQQYVEYTENGQTIKIWLENELSVKARAQLVNKYNLAGIASWRRGYERPEIWDVLKDNLK
ncbi:glycosyl hydrolase family 18 protein [Paenibacillus sp. y28]|uniref:glycosyl hydrolase family 18 protein n=1 Tax=Paenibacillus sp. y28 TaxID=3129110 RepID=UPI003019288A